MSGFHPGQRRRFLAAGFTGIRAGALGAVVTTSPNAARLWLRSVTATATTILILAAKSGGATDTARDIKLEQDAQAGTLRVVVAGAELLTYQYNAAYALPHYWPLRSPSGKLLTVQTPDPYPHHRSLWIADRVQAANAQEVDFYHCWKNYEQPEQPARGFRHFIRHQRFVTRKVDGREALLEVELRWLVNHTKPILDERRRLRVVALGQGEYLLDLAWQLHAAYGDVRFLSDHVHYAWPYLRMHPQFSGEQGGRITSDQGRRGQAETDGKQAKWIDYSNDVQGVKEGLAVFVYPDGKPHRWLTREYGTFGPRRPDNVSGTQFTLPAGESLPGRVGILIHRGDAIAGRVAKRYRQYCEGEL